MIVNVISDINTESVLKALGGRPSISLSEFYRGPYFSNVTELNYSGLKLRKTVDSLLSGGFIETPDENASTVWRITSKGLNHLAFLEQPNVKEIENVKVTAGTNLGAVKKPESVSTIRRDVEFIVSFLHGFVLHIVGKN